MQTPVHTGFEIVIEAPIAEQPKPCGGYSVKPSAPHASKRRLSLSRPRDSCRSCKVRPSFAPWPRSRRWCAAILSSGKVCDGHWSGASACGGRSTAAHKPAPGELTPRDQAIPSHPRRQSAFCSCPSVRPSWLARPSTISCAWSATRRSSAGFGLVCSGISAATILPTRLPIT